MVRYIIGYVIFGNGTTLTLPSNGYIYIYIERERERERERDEADKYKWQQNLRTCGFFGYYLY